VECPARRSARRCFLPCGGGRFFFMSLELKPIQVRLPEEAYDVLRMIADAQDKDMGEVAREMLTKMLMGEGHAIKVMAERLSRATKSGRER
jgi:plasmid stability protein